MDNNNPRIDDVTRLVPVGVAAAVALLVVSVFCTLLIHPGVIPFLYLFNFVVWGIFILPYSRKGKRIGYAKVFWGYVALLTVVTMSIQTMLQFGIMGDIPDHLVKLASCALNWLGFKILDSRRELIGVLSSMVLCLVSSCLQVWKLSHIQSESDTQEYRMEGIQNNDEHDTLSRHSSEFVRFCRIAVKSTNVWGLTTLLIFAYNAFTKSSLFGSIYCIGLVAAMQYWSSCGSAYHSTGWNSSQVPGILECWQLTAAQCLCTCHLIVDYLWIGSCFFFEDLEGLKPWMRLVGINTVDFQISDEGVSFGDSSMWILLKIVSIPLLIICLGYLKSTCINSCQSVSMIYQDSLSNRENLLEHRSSSTDISPIENEYSRAWIDAHAASAVNESLHRIKRTERIRFIQSGVGRALESVFASESWPSNLDFSVFEEDCPSENERIESSNGVPANELTKTALFLSDSVLSYTLFLVAWLWDLGLLSLLLILSAWCFALVHGSGPPIGYWHVIVLYCEALIVATYLWHILATQNEFPIPSFIISSVNILGIHSAPFGCIPLICAYAAALYHHRDLLLQEQKRSWCAETALECDSLSHFEYECFSQNRKNSTGVTWLNQLNEFLRMAMTPCERPPSFLLVDVAFKGSDYFTPDDHLGFSENFESSENMVEMVLQRMLNESLGNYAPRVRFHSFQEIRGSKSELEPGRNLEERTCLILVHLPKISDLNQTRSLFPARDAANSLYEIKRAKIPGVDSELEILKVEAHSRQGRDFYAIIAAFDMLAIFLSALWFNSISKAAGSLTDITSEHVVPLGYLLTLIVLFLFLVLDRTVYVFGSQAGKAALHGFQLIIWMWYCSLLVWGPTSPATGVPELMMTGPPERLRLLLLVKSFSFSFNALQLRCGYPPPASYSDGFGRQTLIFMRSLTPLSSLGFRIFSSIPFLYELRALLDWTCTPTTLSLYDYFKLEDINMGLHNAAIIQKSKSQKLTGVRQPRYLKILQGGLLFSVLIFVLWAPLLLFTTGAPTYQVPNLVYSKSNATLIVSEDNKTPSKTMPKNFAHSSLYEATDRNAWIQWTGSNDTLPFALSSGYIPSQLQLSCAPSDSDHMWSLTPPLKSFLVETLEMDGSSGSIEFVWHFLRDLPPPSARGGPACTIKHIIPLSPNTRSSLSKLISEQSSESVDKPHKVDIMRYSNGSETAALYPFFWSLRGDPCEAKPLDVNSLPNGEALPGHRPHFDTSWIDRWVACSASIEQESDLSKGYMPLMWWSLDCHLINKNGEAKDPQLDGRAYCPKSHLSGPQLVLLLERVQGGVLGATLNKYGVLGLYSVVVLGIGRFIRLAVTNLRMRIIYEDLPTTKRLNALVRDIYLARSEGLLLLEEELFNVLTVIYRLPSLMFQLTKKSE